MKGQAYIERAKQAASELVYGKEVTLQTFGKDKYGRTIADVLLPDGMNVNHELGHTQGLGHRADTGCVMAFSNSLVDTDRKGKSFCSCCTQRLRGH